MSTELDVQTRGSRAKVRAPVKGKYLIIAGAVLLALGILALVGVASYIQYTNNYTRNSQAELKRKWDEKPLPVTRLSGVTVADGAPIASISIPAIDVDAIVVELANMDDKANLNRGPGHVPGTAYPGMAGNVFIAGHRTTYGAPFGRIDELRKGDQVVLTTAERKSVYSVYEQRIVAPNDLSVLGQDGEPKVTLMACHPRFSASQRILVLARLLAEPLAEPPGQPGP